MLIFVPAIKYPANRQTVKDPDVPMDKLNRFRIMSILTITLLWIVLGITFEILWDRLKPDETAQFLLKNYKIDLVQLKYISTGTNF